MHSFSSNHSATTAGAFGETGYGAIAPFPGLACLQFRSFLILTNRSWQTLYGSTECLPFKIFGWNPNTQDFSLCLFDASFSDLESYAELDPESDRLVLYQCSPDIEICYIYQPHFQDAQSAYPTQYGLQVLVSADAETWEVVAEGEYR
jgi:hypothetical protein